MVNTSSSRSYAAIDTTYAAVDIPDFTELPHGLVTAPPQRPAETSDSETAADK